MPQPEEKKYIRTHIKKVTFDNGGSLLNASIHIDKLTDHANEDGWVKIKICERREPSEKGATHYAYIDEFKPEPKHDEGVHNHPLGAGFAQKDTKSQGPNDPGDENDKKYEEELPF